jgi:hypothetical protein
MNDHFLCFSSHWFLTEPQFLPFIIPFLFLFTPRPGPVTPSLYSHNTVEVWHVLLTWRSRHHILSKRRLAIHTVLHVQWCQITWDEFWQDATNILPYSKCSRLEIMKEQSNQPSKVGQISHDYIGSLFFMFNSLWARRSGGAKEAVMCSATI